MDDTWHPVRPGAFYACAARLRTSATVSMRAGFDWHGPTGTYLSTSAFGTDTAVSTSSFTLVSKTGVVAPAGAAYGIPFWVNATTTGSAITVYLDDPQAEEVDAAGVSLRGLCHRLRCPPGGHPRGASPDHPPGHLGTGRARPRGALNAGRHLDP